MAAPHPRLLPLLIDEDPSPERAITADLISSAEEHHVAALLEQAIADRKLPAADHIRRRLTANVIAAEAENSAAEACLSELARVADALDVQIAVFKGLAIGGQFYAEPHRRPAVDVDVFLAPDSLAGFGSLVNALSGSDADVEAVDTMARTNQIFEISLNVGRTLVDIHRDPMNMLVLPADEDERWDRTTPLDLLCGAGVRTLDLEDTVIQSLLNLFRDNFADLLHINDVRLMLETEPDWDEVERRADLNGWTTLIRYALWFVSDQLGQISPLPTTMQRWKRRAIESMWPSDLLLKGSESHARSLRRQSATGLLVSGLPAATARAYGQRLLPPRIVIDQRSGHTDGLYLTALTRWRLAQRRENAAFRDASYRDGQ